MGAESSLLAPFQVLCKAGLAVCGQKCYHDQQWSVAFLFASFIAMDFSTLRFFVFVCIGVMVSVPMIPWEFVRAQEMERINLWSPNRNTNRQDNSRVSDSDHARRISQSFQKEFDSDSGRRSRDLANYSTLLAVVVVIAAGFVGWRMWRQQQLARELSDPLFLVRELNSAHQLSDQEKRLMQELSAKHLLPTPLKLFVEPKYLLEAWENEAFASSQPMVRQLLSKLFDIVKA